MSHRVLRRLRRLALQAFLLVLGVIILNFVLVQLLPGDAAEVFAGEAGIATQETMAMLRERFGVDQPVLVQLLIYLGGLVRLDLGFSVRYNAPVAEVIFSRLQMTLLLNFAALVLAVLIGLLFGIVMANLRGRWPDRALSALALTLYSTPGFWIGLMLIVLFSVQLGWLPSDGYRTIGASLHGWDYAWDLGRHLILPAFASATFFIAIVARLTRTAMIEIRQQDFVRTAVAKGLPAWRVTLRHVLRNALIPLTTMVGMQVGALLGGAVVIETIFAWPGLGRLAYDAILGREYVVLLGILLISSLLVIAANVLTDLLQAWLDPRIKD
ncbi:peptide/nickel transport system permease protein [Lampropedia hyalina DSM 16112]|jgi:peptide/nickel transport system permease protein|uniref:Peptide/nickel transport system permease protein n=1 Tax=Lampropedia hyalina DSM 16112 TaxID=1122156 RepID=A0A1M4SMS2_9BURK|nr:ABC transporter permease [Lampropedia hyalina]SHE33564.1 peptide/nickel transport system permease protein [Lampropedia hyalina DSM 16112]